MVTLVPFWLTSLHSNRLRVSSYGSRKDSRMWAQIVRWSGGGDAQHLELGSCPDGFDDLNRAGELHGGLRATMRDNTSNNIFLV